MKLLDVFTYFCLLIALTTMFFLAYTVFNSNLSRNELTQNLNSNGLWLAPGNIHVSKIEVLKTFTGVVRKLDNTNGVITVTIGSEDPSQLEEVNLVLPHSNSELLYLNGATESAQIDRDIFNRELEIGRSVVITIKNKEGRLDGEYDYIVYASIS